MMGAFMPLLVMTGMHWSFTPVIVQSYATYGSEAIMGPGSFVSNICQGAASLAVAVKTKNRELRQVASSAGITALLGVTEPAMFGVTLRLKKPLYAVMIGGACGGLYAGLNGVVPVSYTHLDVYKRQVPIRLHPKVTAELKVNVREA